VQVVLEPLAARRLSSALDALPLSDPALRLLSGDELAVFGAGEHPACARFELDYSEQANCIAVTASVRPPPTDPQQPARARVTVDARQPLAVLKQALAQALRLPVDAFRLRLSLNTPMLRDLDKGILTVGFIPDPELTPAQRQLVPFELLAEMGPQLAADEFVARLVLRLPRPPGSQSECFQERGRLHVRLLRPLAELKASAAALLCGEAKAAVNPSSLRVWQVVGPAVKGPFPDDVSLGDGFAGRPVAVP